MTQITESQINVINKMFDDGNGVGKISVALKLPYGVVTKHLKSVGRWRTKQESLKVRPPSKKKGPHIK